MLRFLGWVLWLVGLLPVQATVLPETVQDFVRRAVTNGSTEYRGSLVASSQTYYLFILRQQERMGVMLIREDVRHEVSIAAADTSLTSFRLLDADGMGAVILEGVRSLLQQPNLRQCRGAAPALATAEVAQVGPALDRILRPITGFALQTNATLDILRRLQEANTLFFEPRKAPAGSILVCPTRFAPAGPVELGHAGILARDRCVYAADAERHGAWRRFGTLDQWLEKFEPVNRVYAFFLRAPAGEKRRAQAPLPPIRR